MPFLPQIFYNLLDTFYKRLKFPHATAKISAAGISQTSALIWTSCKKCGWNWYTEKKVTLLGNWQIEKNSPIQISLESYIAILFSVLNLSVLNNSENASIWRLEEDTAGRLLPLQIIFTPYLYKCLSNVWYFSELLQFPFLSCFEQQSLNRWNRMLLTKKHIMKTHGKIQAVNRLSASCFCWTLMILHSSQQGPPHISKGTVVKANWKLNFRNSFRTATIFRTFVQNKQELHLFSGFAFYSFLDTKTTGILWYAVSCWESRSMTALGESEVQTAWPKKYMVTYGPSSLPLAPENRKNNKQHFITVGICSCLQGKSITAELELESK